MSCCGGIPRDLADSGGSWRNLTNANRKKTALRIAILAKILDRGLWKLAPASARRGDGFAFQMCESRPGARSILITPLAHRLERRPYKP